MELYESPHGDGCQCGCLNLSDDAVFDTAFKKVPKNIEADFLQQVWDEAVGPTKLHRELFQEHYGRIRGGAMAGYGRYFSNPRSLEELADFQNMSKNGARFCAAKQQSMIEELIDLRFDADGRKRERGEWEKLANGVLKRHNGYLKHEIVSAQAAAHSVETWKEIQKRKAIYPNLKYVTAGDQRVRDQHRALDGAVYPVDHSFWDTWMPPNGSKCRCDKVQTDEPENRIEPEGEPQKGFRHNPGKTGQLFSDDHPYFNRANNRKKLFDEADLMRERMSREEVRDFMRENVVSKLKEFSLPGRPEKFTLYERDLINALRHPHKSGPEKNELLYALAHALRLAVFLAEGPNTDPKKNQTVGWLYFSLEWLGLNYVFNFQKLRMPDGEIRTRLYAIKDDNPDLEK